MHLMTMVFAMSIASFEALAQTENLTVSASGKGLEIITFTNCNLYCVHKKYLVTHVWVYFIHISMHDKPLL